MPSLLPEAPGGYGFLRQRNDRERLDRRGGEPRNSAPGDYSGSPSCKRCGPRHWEAQPLHRHDSGDMLHLHGLNREGQAHLSCMPVNIAETRPASQTSSHARRPSPTITSAPVRDRSDPFYWPSDHPTATAARRSQLSTRTVEWSLMVPRKARPHRCRPLAPHGP